MKAFSCLSESFSWLFRRGVRRFVFIPLAINTALFGFATYYAIHYSEGLMNHFLPPDSWLSYLRWLLWPLVAISVIIVIFYGFSLVANLIAAPFNSFLSAAVEKLETGNAPESGLTLWQEVVTGIGQELQKLVYFLLLGIPTLIFALLLPPFSPLIWFVYAAWCGALQYMDYPMANRGILFKDQRVRLKAKRFDTLTFGSLVMLLTAIPVINLIAMPICVIGATLYWCRTLRRQPV